MYGVDHGEFAGTVRSGLRQGLTARTRAVGRFDRLRGRRRTDPDRARLSGAPWFPASTHEQRQVADCDDACRIPATGAFTTCWYNDPVLDAAGGETGKTVLVWSVAPYSSSCRRRPGNFARDLSREVWGWAWADRGVDRVEVSVDGGVTWGEGEGGAPLGACLAAVLALAGYGSCAAVLCSRAR